MERKALIDLSRWWNQPHAQRKPLVLRGARQVGKSFLVKDFCRRQKITCLELNFEKEPSLRKLFVEGDNSKTVALLEVHFGRPLSKDTLLFLDEIQTAPEVFARLRYFYEESNQIAVIAAGSLLEFALAELEYSVPVGRIQYLFLGPMTFEEFLFALGEVKLINFIKEWDPRKPNSQIPEIIHDKLLSHVRDFTLIGGMPEAIAYFISNRSYLDCAEIQRNILETYRNDFAKYRKKIPIDRLERVFNAIPKEVGNKWVYKRISEYERAQAIEIALEALCKAKIAHQVFHSSGNGIPLAAEKKDNLYKVIFLDIGLMGVQLGLKITDFSNFKSFFSVNEGALAEQWIGQHLLDLRMMSQSPELHYWVREKAGSMAEVDYLIPHGMLVIPIEIKAGSSLKAKSLQVFLSEKQHSTIGVHFSINPAQFYPDRKILSLPFYFVEQLPHILDVLKTDF